jgi:LPS-assembly lipoprotein
MMKFIALPLMIILGACSFTPLYKDEGTRADSGSAAASDEISRYLKSVEVAPIPTRLGQLLKNRLDDRIKTDAVSAPLYRLEIGLTKERQPIIIQQDRQILRYNVGINSKYNLVEIATGKVVDGGTIKLRSGYNVVDSDYATFAAEESAAKNAIEQLAIQYEAKLANYFVKIDD